MNVFWRRSLRTKLLLVGVAICAMGGSVLTAPSASAAKWADCGGSPFKQFMSVQAKGLPCSSAWILGEEALDSWNGFSAKVKVRGFKCKMLSGYPNHVGVSITCKKGKKGAKLFTGD